MIELDCRGFGYDHGEVLSGVRLAVAAGEAVTVVGASGSGKSALARLLAGQFDADAGNRFEGSLELAGERLEFFGRPDDPRIDPAAWSGHVGYVGQNAWAQLSLVSGTVAEEISFGMANRGVPRAQMEATVRRLAARLRLEQLLGRDPRRLSGGQLQKTVIAAAVAGGPRLLVLDEPFQGLDAAGREDVGAVLAALRSEGTAVVLFEPMLPAAGDPAERVLALSGGRIVFAGTAAEAGTAGLEQHGIGRFDDPPGLEPAGGSAAPPAGSPAEGSDPAPADPAPADPERRAAVSLAGVHHAYAVPRRFRADSVPAALAGVSLCVGPGEAVALLGANGSGKSTLLRHLNGLLRPATGTVRVLGREVGGRPPGELAGSVGFLFQDSDQQLFERTVLREVSYGPRALGAGPAEARQAAAAALAAAGLDGVADAHPHELGFVQRRLVALASLMAAGPPVWALDEPTAGLDQRGRQLLASLLARQLAAGGSVLLATHDLPFARALCHRGVVLEHGRVSAEMRFR